MSNEERGPAVPVTEGLRLGRYVVRTPVGSGGMGDVFLADDTQLGRRVALKFVRADAASGALAQRRLLREARAAALLDHPHICAIYEVGEADGRTYIAMQYVEGETLDTRLQRSPMDLSEILPIAVQTADALSEAHAHHLLHRDIKPANIMVSTRGDARVMDFGLAKHDPTEAGSSGSDTMSALSQHGAVIGTVAYMSPEQARGEPLDARSDLFSLGIVFYEMVSGRRPFQGTSSAAVAAAILTQDPLPLARFASTIPPELERIVSKLLKKAPDSRYQSAKDLLIDLRALKEDREFQERLGRTPMPPAPAANSERALAAPATAPRTASSPARTPARRRAQVVAASLMAALVIVAAGWLAWQRTASRHAEAQVAQVVALADAGRSAEAYDLAVVVEATLPGNATIAGLLPTISDTVSVTTEPAGASVFVKRFDSRAAGADTPRQPLGLSPVSNARVARGEYVLSIEKDGYAPVERTVSGVAIRNGTLTITPPPIRVNQRLLPASAVPARMVSVPGGDYRLISWSRPTDRRVRLADYFIDKYEVSNQEYKEFVDGGGYVTRELWRHPFVKDGRQVAWDEAMRVFVDRTGLPGPRTWSNRTFPEGRGSYPVTDLTWYEADAYAAFRGKRLPTVFEWEKAARNGYMAAAGIASMPWGAFYPGDQLAGRANFGPSVLPATSGEFGMSAFGAYNMAGNVSEWTANDSSEGFLATGGGWGDPTYTFAQFGGRPGFFASEKLGFRCVRTDALDDQGGARIELDQEVPHYTAPSDRAFAELASVYRYDKVPLEARIEQATETPEWRKETISFKAANGGRAVAYLYLPNHVPRPLQVIHFLPAGDVDSGFRSLSNSMDDRMAPFVRAGRAAFGVALQGYIERLRPASFVRPDYSTVEFTETVVDRITDLRRGLAYLETRPDLDMNRVAMMAPSAGSTLGMVLGAIEPRYRALVFIGAGIPSGYRVINAAANPINFASRIRAPKLIVQGRYDEDTPLRYATEPFLALLVEPKRLVLYDGGHVPSIEVMMNSTSAWLEEQLGRPGFSTDK